MRILHRQIFQEVSSHALLGLVLFSFVLFLRDTSRLLELLLRESVFEGPILGLWLTAFPALFTFTIPMAVLVGILIGLSRMANDGEVTALRASGMSVRTILYPVGLFAALGCILALYLSVHLSPLANRHRVELESEIGWRQISAELQPRVFEERFPDLILYVQDVLSGPNPGWKGIFLADLSNPSSPKITLAQEGILLSQPARNQLQLHLVRGTIHEVSQQTNEYSIATFSETDLPVRLPPSRPPSVRPNALRSTAELYAVPPESPEWLEARVEFHRRLALPLAALFLTLLAVPLGISSPKGGKSTGIILTLFMVLAYYTLFVGGITLARQGWLPPWAGVWGANLLFGLGGLALLSQADGITPALGWVGWLASLPEAVGRWFSSWRRLGRPPKPGLGRPAPGSSGFPLILDRYVLKIFSFYFILFLVASILLAEVVTFFLDLLNDVIRNHIPASMVLDYFVHLTPQLIYDTTPLSVLVAILVSFGILSQTNEITAVKTSGISLFRLALPLFVVSGLLSVGLFLFEDFYIPAANRHQDAVRNRIKGRPAQTYYRPDRKWILGEGSRIYYYNFFEPTERVLGGVTVFELEPKTFQLVRRISAAHAHWEPSLAGWTFYDGWVRVFDEGSVRSFEPFQVRLDSEFHEPPSYFLKEDKRATQMNYSELRRYVQDLQQSGFDVVPLSVQLHRKFSFPLIALIMALIGMPFAFSMGRKGALTGIALSLGIGIVYWLTSNVFQALGNLNELPPVVAAWSPNVLFGLGGLYLFLRIET